MDITKLAVAATGTIHVKDTEGVPLYDGDRPVRIIVHGPGSRAYGVVESRTTNRMLKRINDNDGKATAATTEERRAELAEDLTTVTVAFEHLTYGDAGLQGEALFHAVYSDPALGFIAKQVNKHLADWGNFKGAAVES